ncbi:Anamorsin [Chionoecetes opilio]|uniref:Anamorsin homolog n=1 Tax=Chionoecetes opilio TaxID=41210 RepID=A0A8J4Y4D0_CHIOP|nr:Anamorsin [Chionoecetes opilio]
MFGISGGQQVMVVWSQPVNQDDLKSLVEQLKCTVGGEGKVAVENAEMLPSSAHPASSHHHVLACVLPPFVAECPAAVLGEVLRVLRPGGSLTLRTTHPADLRSTLTLGGFTNVSPAGNANLTDEQKRGLVTPVLEVTCKKPDFEVGSSLRLPGAGPPPAATWNIDLGDDLDLASPDDLLTEEDLAVPEPSSLKVCGTTGQRKACRSCVCGLKEELEGEEQEQKEEERKTFKSSCGSCYLGDAFRCASCPYLGMPAFKPGDKVKLADDTLKDTT